MSITLTDLPTLPARVAPLPLEEEFPERRLGIAPRPARRRRPKLVYGIVALMGALAITAAQMVVSIMTTETSYQLSSLQREQRDLTYQKQILSDEVAGLSSPQYLAANAAALGMVIGDAPSYLRLSDGALIGAQSPSSGASSVDALGRAAVANALVTDTPLVTAPDATIQGVPLPPVTDPTGATVIPPALTDGLPTPTTR
jgi:hypothetical protein